MVSEFETWWYHEGSAPPLPGYDMEEHCKRMCQIAWDNGAFKEREACAKAAEDYLTQGRSPLGRSVGAIIRARSQS